MVEVALTFLFLTSGVTVLLIGLSALRISSR